MIRLRSLAVLATAGVLGAPAVVYAQSPSVGFRAGASLATVSSERLEDPQTRTGVAFGFFLELPFSGRAALEPGLSYVQKGTELSLEEGDVTFKLDYFQIPLLVRYDLGTGPGTRVHLYGGPTMSFESNCELDAGAVNVNCDDAVDAEDEGVPTNGTDFGAMVGGGVSFRAGESVRFRLDALYDFGFSDVDDSMVEPDNLKNRAFLLSLAVSVPTQGM